MLHAGSIYLVVSAPVVIAVAAVALSTIRRARKTHSSLAAAFLKPMRVMRSAFRDDGEARFRTLAEALPQIVWTAIPGKGVDYCNRRWFELTGFTEPQTLGWGWANALTPMTVPWPSRIGRNAAARANRSR